MPCDIMIIGEAAGKEEEEWGLPFIGRAGRVLVRLLKKHTGLSRKEVYITNAVKQRPPLNRTPYFQEIMAHREFLIKEIETVRPKVIVCLGKTAIKAIVGRDVQKSVSDYRSIRLTHNTIPVICTFHPASLFYGGDIKAMEEDYKKIKPYLKNKGANNG